MNLKKLFLSSWSLVTSLSLFVSCQTEKIQKTDTLQVIPDESIIFKASGNPDVILEVQTNLSAWDYQVPDWIQAAKEKDKLVLNATSNLEQEDRYGRLVVTAGNAVPVKINLRQEAAQDSGKPVVGQPASLVTHCSSTLFLDSQFQTTLSVSLKLETAATETVKAHLELDSGYLNEYEFISGNDCELFPKDGVPMDKSDLTVEVGQTESDILEITVKGNPSLLHSTGYLVPLKVVADQNVSFDKEKARANFIVMRTNVRTLRNIVYFEVNDVNPLNALEYALEDGSNFFDAVILFAANINYDTVNDVVYLSNNPNVQALLDNSETYLQPLRKAGIKVYLGLLGNHDASGLCQLSDWGAAEWAKEVALACKEYKLDGVNLDDEYSSSPIPGNKWFTTPGPEAGSRLCYELKKGLSRECYWPTEVSYFVWGNWGRASAVEDMENHQLHQPKEFIDFYLANYGAPSEPYGGFTMKNCSAMSYELNRHYGEATVQEVQQWKQDGYGWVMWFAFNPVPGSSTENLSYAFPHMNTVSDGIYGQKILFPAHYYKKTGEGEYDPVPYDFQ